MSPGAVATGLALAVLGACGPALVEPPPAPPTTVGLVQEAGCFAAGDCGGSGKMCVDPRYPVCGNLPSCEDGSIACGCSCVAACTATSCEPDEVCGAAGCCEPRSCAGDSQCGSAGSRCVAGRCVRRGTCERPPF